jgi:hypothetical protein
MNEAIESCRALLRGKFSAMERHIDDLRLSALNSKQCAVDDVESRLAALEYSITPTGGGQKLPTSARRKTTTVSITDQPVGKARRVASSSIDACAVRAERRALATLRRLSRSIDEAECAVVRAMLMRMDAAAAESCTIGPISSGAECA